MATLEKLLGDFLNPSKRDEAKKEKSYYGKAQRLAKKLGLWIETDNIYEGFGEPVNKGQWVCGDDDFYKSLGWEDGFFSTSWSECYGNLLDIQGELSKESNNDQ
jgi:hypothetical protein